MPGEQQKAPEVFSEAFYDPAHTHKPNFSNIRIKPVPNDFLFVGPLHDPYNG